MGTCVLNVFIENPMSKSVHNGIPCRSLWDDEDIDGRCAENLSNYCGYPPGLPVTLRPIVVHLLFLGYSPCLLSLRSMGGRRDQAVEFKANLTSVKSNSLGE